MRISVIGTGYVGLVTGTCLAETGNYVNCVDIDENKISQLRKGVIPIFEPKLAHLVKRNHREGRLSFTTKLDEGVRDSQVVFLALPTPPNEDGSADLQYVLDVAKKMGHILNQYTVIVDKSTVPVGTAQEVKKQIAEHARVDFDVVSNPEFLREGVAVDDFLKPERIIIGTSSDRAKKIMTRLYQPYIRQGNPILFMDEKSAELTKYAANSFLATKISFMNEMANLCERVGADVDQVRKGMGTDSRIGKRFLFAGIGYGGSCFPKDVKALNKTAVENDYDFDILQAVMRVNVRQRNMFFSKIWDVEKTLENKKIGIWGLAFKPDTDDIREAPSLYLIQSFLEKKASVYAYDPEAMDNAKQILGDRLTWCNTPYKALKDVDMLIIMTEWTAFRTPDFEKMKQQMKKPVIYDGRNVYNVSKMKERGFDYYSVGRQAY